MLILLSPPQRGEITLAPAPAPISSVGDLRMRLCAHPISPLCGGESDFDGLAEPARKGGLREAKCQKSQEGGCFAPQPIVARDREVQAWVPDSLSFAPASGMTKGEVAPASGWRSECARFRDHEVWMLPLARIRRAESAVNENGDVGRLGAGVSAHHGTSASTKEQSPPLRGWSRSSEDLAMACTETFLRLVVSMVAVAVLFGGGMVAVMSMPRLAADAGALLPYVAVASCLLAPLPAAFVAPRMRIRHWGRAAWGRGDFISGRGRR